MSSIMAAAHTSQVVQISTVKIQEPPGIGGGFQLLGSVAWLYEDVRINGVLVPLILSADGIHGTRLEKSSACLSIAHVLTIAARPECHTKAKFVERASYPLNLLAA